MEQPQKQQESHIGNKVTSVRLCGIDIPVKNDLTKFEIALKLFPDDEELFDGKKPAEQEVLGAFDNNEEKIYVAKNIGNALSARVLIHEVAEAINFFAELELEDNHTKIVALDLMLLDLISNNKDLIKYIWEVNDGRTKN